MPPGPPQGSILSCEPQLQLTRLRQLLAPQRWPLDAALLPSGTVLVGGAVRDALLGRTAERPDLDFVVPGDAIALARDLARQSGGTCVVLDRERSIARLVLQGWSFDLARCCGGSLEEDLLRRDYGINAIALALDSLCGSGEQGPIDPGGGLEDLRRGWLRALGEANLLADPLRLLRGPRLVGQLGFQLEPRTRQWIERHQPRLATVAAERVLAELERLVASPAAPEALSLLLDLDLLQAWGGGGESARGALTLLTRERAEACGLRAEEAEAALPLARLAELLPVESVRRLRTSRRLQQRLGRLRHWREQLGGLSAAAEASDNAPVGPGSVDRMEAGTSASSTSSATSSATARATARATASASPGPERCGLIPENQAAPVRSDRSRDRRLEPPAAASAALPRGVLDTLAEPQRLALQRDLEEDLPALALQLAPEEAADCLRRWRDPDDPLFHPRSPLDGRTLQQQLALRPGPLLGDLQTYLCGERAFGRLPRRDGSSEALAQARRWLEARGESAAGPSATGPVA